MAGLKKKMRWKEKTIVVLEFPLSLPLALPSFVSCLLPSKAKDIIVVSTFCNYCDAYKSIYLVQDFPGGSGGEESNCSAGNPGSIPGSGRSLGGGNATHSSILAWRIPWTVELDGIPSMRSQRIRHG